MEIIDALPDHDKNGSSTITPQVSAKGLNSRDFNLKTAELIKSQIGDIEEIRNSLGLSKRKMCQLLLIDPSTWTRWTTGKTTPPPYVYRMLQWGLAIMEKHPETHPLANYEKFEQIKKIKELEDRLNQFESSESVNFNASKHSNKRGLQSTQTVLILFILLASFLFILKF